MELRCLARCLIVLLYYVKKAGESYVFRARETKNSTQSLSTFLQLFPSCLCSPSPSSLLGPLSSLCVVIVDAKYCDLAFIHKRTSEGTIRNENWQGQLIFSDSFTLFWTLALALHVSDV